MARFHDLTISDIRRETPDTVSIAFEVPTDLADDFGYVQGQHLTLRAELNDEDIRRNYSICSAVGEDDLRVAIKHVDDGAFSSYANTELAVGDKVAVMPPTGRFYTNLDPDNTKTYVAFAAGSGITPIISIIKTTLETEPDAVFILFYGNRNMGSIIFREALEDLKNLYLDRFSLYHVLSGEETDVALFHGRIDAERASHLLAGFCPADTVDEFFICGPGDMIDAVRKSLKGAGVAGDRVHFELFTPNRPNGADHAPKPPAKILGKNTDSNVAIIVDGIRTEFRLPYNDENILDAALARGADLPFSCKGGVCCSCRAKLRDGQVDMRVNYALEPKELEQGFILTCQSRPLTDQVVIDFDEA